jgi:DNA-binding MarR family transcriptional regulator
MDKQMKDNFDIFFRRKPALMLVSLKKNNRMRYGSVLAKEVDCTYSHAVKILQTLEELKLVDFEKKGRIKLIKLTKKGIDVADAIENIQKLVK